MNTIPTLLPKNELLNRAADFFRNTIILSHLKNLAKLKSLKEFSYNPFLLTYLAKFISGDASSYNIAKALIYPRIMGTSINTSFGSNLQKFCSVVLPGFGSAVSGIDLEFLDYVDGRRKYCQIKAGPQTINKDDTDTIDRHFSAIKNLAKTNNLPLGINDLVVGVLYGTPDELSTFYKKIDEKYPVFVGQDFWYRITGYEDFYIELITTFSQVAEETNAQQAIEEIIQTLAIEVEEKILSPQK